MTAPRCPTCGRFETLCPVLWCDVWACKNCSTHHSDPHPPEAEKKHRKFRVRRSK